MNSTCDHPDCLNSATCNGECTGYVQSAVTPLYRKLKLIPIHQENKYQKTLKVVRK